MTTTPENKEETPQSEEETTSEEKPEEAESEESNDPEESENSDEPSKEDTSDYDKELKRIEQDKEEKRKGYAMRKGKKDDDEEEEEQEDIDEKIQKAVKEAVAGVQKDVQRSNVETLLRQQTGSDSEFKLALHHYDNSINPSGSVNDDVENAVLLANKHRLKGVESEKKRSSQSEDTRSHSETEQRKRSSAEPNISADAKARLERSGFQFNSQSGMYERKVSDRLTMRLDPKTGQRKDIRS